MVKKGVSIFNDAIRKKVSREYYPYSERLLDLRIQGLEGSSISNWDFGKMADMVGLTKEEYIKYEYEEGDMSVDEYKEVIKRLTVKMREEERLNEPEEVNLSTGDLKLIGETLGLNIILYNEEIKYNPIEERLEVGLYLSVKDSSYTLEEYNNRDKGSFKQAREELASYGWKQLKDYEDRYIKKVVINT